MEWYAQQEIDGIVSIDDKPMEIQRIEQGTFMSDWTLYKEDYTEGFSFDDPFVYVGDGKDMPSQGKDEANKFSYWCELTSPGCTTRCSEVPSGRLLDCQLQNMERTDDFFLSQFSDEDIQIMETPFQALQMFPDSMYRLLSFENMLTDPQSHMAHPDQNGINTMDTCGFPLFTHDMKSDSENTNASSLSCVLPKISEMSESSSESKAEASSIKSSRLIAGADNSGCLEAMVLEELEGILMQLTEKTRVCYRDAFYRLADNSTQQRKTNEGRIRGLNSRPSPQEEGNNSRLTASEPVEKETNVIDRTVAYLVFNQACLGPPDHASAASIHKHNGSMASGT